MVHKKKCLVCVGLTEFLVRQDHGYDTYCNLVFDGVRTIQLTSAGIPLINESNSLCVLKPESLENLKFKI